MNKNLTQFKSTIQGIENYFYFDSNCPIDIAKESLFECLKWIGQIEDAAKSVQQQTEESPKEEDQQVIEEVSDDQENA